MYLKLLFIYFRVEFALSIELLILHFLIISIISSLEYVLLDTFIDLDLSKMESILLLYSAFVTLSPFM